MNQKQQPKPVYRVSVTTFEKLRRFLASGEEDKFDNEENLIKSLTGVFEGNDKTRFGSAFHKIIEFPDLAATGEGVLVTEKEERLVVPTHVAKVATEYRKNHPLMVCEVPVGKIYSTDKYQVYVSGRCDGLEGVEIRDPKTKYRNPTATEYMDSYQWRFYLDILGLKVFHYDIFEVKYFDSLINDNGVYRVKATTGRDRQPRNVEIKIHEPVTCTAYSGLHTDCTRLVASFMDYIENRNFFHLLKQMQNEAPVL